MTRRSALALLGASMLMPLQASADRAGSPVRPAGIGNANQLHYFSIQEIARLIASRELSPTDLTMRMLDRIAAVDGRLRSYATVMAEQAMADARIAEREISAGRYRGPLHGVPVAVKDLCYTKGVRTMGGTPVLRSFVPDFDATVVTRLRDAGAIVLGKLNLTEGAMGGYHPSFGIPVNPWGSDRWAGVSSSGSGVAVAAGLCFAAIGTDTGGSIRFPASANGIVGLKPTYGRVSRHGVLPLAESLDHVGPMARRVADVAVMLDAVSGFDHLDASSLQEPALQAFDGIARGVDGLTVGIDRDYALSGVDRGVAASIEDALEMLANRGARIVDVQMPDLADIPDAWFHIVSSEALVAHAAHYPSRDKEYGNFFRGFLESASKITDVQVAAARRRQGELTIQLTEVLESVDAIICPAGDVPSPRMPSELLTGPREALNSFWVARSESYDPPLKDSDLFTMPTDMAGTPAICLPSGFSPDGMPYSIQFIGRRFSEPMLCRLAYAYETGRSWHTRHPVDT